MTTFASIVFLLASFVFQQPEYPDFYDLPPSMQKMIGDMCDDYGQIDGTVFERHSENLHRVAMKEYKESDTERIKTGETSYIIQLAGTRLSDAFGISKVGRVIAEPPSKWTIHGEDFMNPETFCGEGSQWGIHCEIFQKLPFGQALVRFNYSEYIIHFDGSR